MTQERLPLARVFLLGGTSEIGLATVRALHPTVEVILAARDALSLSAAAEELRRDLPGVVVTEEQFDAGDLTAAERLVDAVFDRCDVDVVLPAFGVLGDQSRAEADPQHAAEVLHTNVVGQAVVLLAVARRLRTQGHGTLVVYSSIAGVRARRANFVYGASKAAVDALGTGLAAALHATGAHVLLVRPGFVIGRMTEGMDRAPFATTPEEVAQATADALRTRRRTVWVPAKLAPVAAVFAALPWTVWRRLPR